MYHCSWVIKHVTLPKNLSILSMERDFFLCMFIIKMKCFDIWLFWISACRIYIFSSVLNHYGYLKQESNRKMLQFEVFLVRHCQYFIVILHMNSSCTQTNIFNKNHDKWFSLNAFGFIHNSLWGNELNLKQFDVEYFILCCNLFYISDFLAPYDSDWCKCLHHCLSILICHSNLIHIL